MTAPSASLSCATTVHCQLFPPPGLVTASLLVASAPLNFMAQVGVPIVSDEVNANVTVFPSILSESSLPLSVDKATDVRVGAVMSAVQAKVLDTVLPLVTESVNAPAFTLTVTAPLAEAVQVAE